MPNCKEGDLAILLHAMNTENIGKIVEVTHECKKGDKYPDGAKANIDPSDPLVWWVRSAGSPLIAKRLGTGIRHTYPVGHCYDKNLRPLRDTEGEDEILRIAGKPKEKEKQ